MKGIGLISRLIETPSDFCLTLIPHFQRAAAPSFSFEPLKRSNVFPEDKDKTSISSARRQSEPCRRDLMPCSTFRERSDSASIVGRSLYLFIDAINLVKGSIFKENSVRHKCSIDWAISAWHRCNAQLWHVAFHKRGGSNTENLASPFEIKQKNIHSRLKPLYRPHRVCYFTYKIYIVDDLLDGKKWPRALWWSIKKPGYWRTDITDFPGRRCYLDFSQLSSAPIFLRLSQVSSYWS